ncbi:hypothetical protein Ancab_024952 [Ancistrocladus abbreviatus]
MEPGSSSRNQKQPQEQTRPPPPPPAGGMKPRGTSLRQIRASIIDREMSNSKIPRPSTSIAPAASVEGNLAKSNHPHLPLACIRGQDTYLPMANVTRIMRRALHPNAKIADDAKDTIQECVSEFIGYITTDVKDRCQNEQRKTITAEDVIWSMDKLGFENYIKPLSLYLKRYREIEMGEDAMKNAFVPFQKRNYAHGRFPTFAGWLSHRCEFASASDVATPSNLSRHHRTGLVVGREAHHHHEIGPTTVPTSSPNKSLDVNADIINAAAVDGDGADDNNN